MEKRSQDPAWGAAKFRGQRGELELAKKCEKALPVRQDSQECGRSWNPSEESVSRREE